MRGKILLADDSITIQKVVNLTFADEGIEVVAVSNGEIAERRLGEINPDLVLADIFMPGKSGYELCQYIKQSPQFKHIPVVLLVGAFEPFDQAEAKRVGADAHLTKPFESRALVETVRKLIQVSPPSSTPAPSSTHAQTAGVEVNWEVATADSLAASEPLAIDYTEFEQPGVAFDDSALQVSLAEESAPSDFGETVQTVPTDSAAGEFTSHTTTDSLEVTSGSENLSWQGRGTGVPSIFAQTQQDAVIDFDKVETIAPPAVEVSSLEVDSLESVEPAAGEGLPSDEQPAQAQQAAEFLAEDEPLGDFFADESARPLTTSYESVLESTPATEYDSAQPLESESQVSAAADTSFTSSEMWAEEAKFAPVDIEAAATEASATGFDLIEPKAETSEPPAHAEETEAAPKQAASHTYLPPEAIDEIVRRVVEQMSDSVVREIAWEVVPDCVERVVERLTRESLSKRL
jgi:CheY-like chemotaxis protein